jgi:major membrane immunogen (membrane-anchored lipoprotein)
VVRQIPALETVSGLAIRGKDFLMEKTFSGVLVLLVFFRFPVLAPGEGKSPVPADSSGTHPDGTVRGKYAFEYEPYLTTVDLKFIKGKIVDVTWVIRDTVRNVPFDAAYERFMGGNAYYVRQCRLDWKGSRTYGPRLIQTQNLDSVDAVTGATWTHMLFKRAVQDALKGMAIQKDGPAGK